MALKKNKNVKGHLSEYWRIIQLSMHYPRGSAVVDVALYKDKATRDADETAVMETYRANLGSYFHDANSGQSDTMKNVSLKEAYKALTSKSQSEEAKRGDEDETVDESLAFFHDALEA